MNAETQALATVFVIDDEQDVRTMVEMHLASAGVACRTFESAEAFLKEFGGHSRGCVLADVMLPGISGVELMEAVRARNPDVPVILLTGHADVDLAVNAFRSGAFDFLVKPVARDSLLETVQKALAQSSARVRERSREAELEERLGVLTPREREIVPLIVAGATSKEIARVLSISHRTVEFYRQSVFRKLGVRSALELAALVKE